MAEHKHAAVLRAIADKGFDVSEYYGNLTEQWHLGTAQTNPLTHPNMKWRIKPEPKPDVVCSGCVVPNAWGFHMRVDQKPNLRLVFDGEDPTKLKSAEVLP